MDSLKQNEQKESDGGNEALNKVQENQYPSVLTTTPMSYDSADTDLTDQVTMTSKGSKESSSSIGGGWVKSSPSSSPGANRIMTTSNERLLDDNNVHQQNSSSEDEDYDIIGIMNKAEEEFHNSLPKEDVDDQSENSKSSKSQESTSTRGSKLKNKLHNMFFNATETWIKGSNSGLSSNTGGSTSKGSEVAQQEDTTDDEDKVEKDKEYQDDSSSSEGKHAKGKNGLENDAEVEKRDAAEDEVVSIGQSTTSQPQQEQPSIGSLTSSDHTSSKGRRVNETLVDPPRVVSLTPPAVDDNVLSTEDSVTSTTEPPKESETKMMDTSMESSSEDFLMSRYLQSQQQQDTKGNESDNRITSWETSIRSNNSSSNTSFMSSVDGLTTVYILDKTYAWIPAKVLQYENDYALVSITLPMNWNESTRIRDDKLRLDELKEADLHPSMKDLPEEDITQLCQQYSVLPATLRKVYYKDYPEGELPLKNANLSRISGNQEEKEQAKRDMAELVELHPAAMLYNLKERHFLQKPYTRVGDIVVALNPFQWIVDLYAPETRDLYATALIWQDTPVEMTDSKSLYDRLGIEPHVYEVSSLAYKGLALDRQDQTILVTGESGAGKTETVKIVMTHLATVQDTRPGGVDEEHSTARETVSRVCKSSPVFEAFGNAKTARNDNSSRFGRLVQLQFELESLVAAKKADRKVPYTDLVGSKTTTYLLEKSRVVSHDIGERTYHIFYQLLAAPREFKHQLWPLFALRDACDFKYLAGIDISDELTLSHDEMLWQETIEALGVFQYHDESLKVLMRALAIVLQLGNITFVEDESTDNHAVIATQDELELLSYMIGVDPQELEETLTSRILTTPNGNNGNDDIRVKLSPQVAKESCDALAKEIYARIFDSMVRRINENTACPERLTGRTFGHISLLDIFGFERFEINRFEQLCINYANEQLHNKYVTDNFNQVKDEYETEGIDVYDFKLIDNAEVLEVLEGRHGLLTSLDEECLRPKGNAEAYVYKSKLVHEVSDCLIDKKLHRKTEFAIRHFAGPVTYEAEQFIQRNTDKLPDGLIECVAMSTNSVIRVEFKTLLSTLSGEDSPSGKRKKRANRTVLEKFRTQLRSLISIMKNTRTRYIRCIKPNNRMEPLITDHLPTMQQLECSGLMTAIAISRESFPTKLPYEFILDRYVYLMKDKDVENIDSMELKDQVHYVLSKWLKLLSKKNRDGTRTLPFACGKTKVFFKAGAQDHLEILRSDYFNERAIIIQSFARQLSATRSVAIRRNSIPTIQSFVRMALELVKFNRKRLAAIRLSAWIRTRLAVVSYVAMVRARSATRIQSRYRSLRQTREFNRIKHAAIVIQRAIKTFIRKAAIAAKLLKLVEEDRMDTSLMALTEQVRNGQSETPDNQTDMFKDVEAEIVSLRGKTDYLREKLVAAESSKRDLMTQTTNFEAATSSFRIRLQDVTKANDVLVKEVFKYRRDLSKLRRSNQAKNLELTNKLTLAEKELQQITSSHIAETKTLQKKLKEAQKVAEQEKQTMRHEMALLKQKSATEVLALREEFHNVQDSHHAYLTELMEVLQRTNAMREQETERISAELTAVKAEKDSRILALQSEVMTLRSEKEISDLTLNAVHSVDDTRKLRTQLEHSSNSRSRRTAQFDDAIQSLSRMVKENDIDLTDNMVRKQKIQKINDMISTLDHLYKMEEDSQVKADQAKVDLIEKYIAVTEPAEVVSEMQDRLARMEADNARLRRQLREKDFCPNCEMREACFEA